ncbi:hypothetical protein ACX3SV_04090 [Hafnia paralvei]
MKQNPFSFYDFLGYLIPGVSLIYLSSVILQYSYPVYYRILSIHFCGQVKTFGDILSYTPLVIASYLLGHVLALISSCLVENYSNKKNGYPSQYLISGCRSGCFRGKKKITMILIWLAVFPISLLDTIFSCLLKLDNKMAARLRPVVFKHCKELLQTEFKMKTCGMNMETGLNGDSFRLIYHYVFENSERHAAKLQNYVALYGFSRNICMVFLLLFWSFFSIGIAKQSCNYIIPMAISSLLSFVFYTGFVKFYKRYTLEAMMAACVIKSNN